MATRLLDARLVHMCRRVVQLTDRRYSFQQDFIYQKQRAAVLLKEAENQFQGALPWPKLAELWDACTALLDGDSPVTAPSLQPETEEIIRFCLDQGDDLPIWELWQVNLVSPVQDRGVLEVARFQNYVAERRRLAIKATSS